MSAITINMKQENKQTLSNIVIFLLFLPTIIILSFLVILIVNKDFRWGIVGHLYHKVVFKQDKATVNNQVTYSPIDSTGTCGCPYCCGAAITK